MGVVFVRLLNGVYEPIEVGNKVFGVKKFDTTLLKKLLTFGGVHFEVVGNNNLMLRVRKPRNKVPKYERRIDGRVVRFTFNLKIKLRKFNVGSLANTRFPFFRSGRITLKGNIMFLKKGLDMDFKRESFSVTSR